ncbi:MAG: hypothetical protein WCW26_04590 [Candidatus Buchananbacteria bacterium]
MTPMETTAKPVAKKPNIWLIVSIVLAVILVIVAGLALAKTMGSKTNESGKMVVLSSDDASKKLLSFINEVYGAQVGPATLKGVVETSGLYEVTVTISDSGKDVDQKVYISKDGSLFIPQAMNIADVLTQFKAYQQQQGAQAGTVPTQTETEPTNTNTADQPAAAQ